MTAAALPDSTKHASLYTPDGILEDVANRFAARGHDEIVAFLGEADGLIARSSDYHDKGAVIDQLGVTAELLAGIGRVFGPHGRRPEGGA